MCSILEIEKKLHLTLFDDDAFHLASTLRAAQPPKIRSQSALQNADVRKGAITELQGINAPPRMKRTQPPVPVNLDDRPDVREATIQDDQLPILVME
jgi:hypothetical protein